MIVTRQMMGTALTDAAAVIDVRADGSLKGLAFALDADLDADNDVVRWELSFASTNAFASNDASNVIYGGIARLTLTTSGAAVVSREGQITFPEPIPVQAGERLYLHIDGSGPASVVQRVWLYLEELAGASRSSVRRR